MYIQASKLQAQIFDIPTLMTYNITCFFISQTGASMQQQVHRVFSYQLDIGVRWKAPEHCLQITLSQYRPTDRR